MDGGRSILRIASGIWIIAALVAGTAGAAGPPLPSDVQITQEQAFLAATREFLNQEAIDPSTILIELKPLSRSVEGTTGNWRALAQVFVDERPSGGYVRRLVFDREYWLESGDPHRFQNHRWAKVMWHEMHHLAFFPLNLSRARELALTHAAKAGTDRATWDRLWVMLLEPMEELAAERACLERYRAAFGPVPDALLNDSRADMRKHAARYQRLREEILAHAQNPSEIQNGFPPGLPVDESGNIRPDVIEKMS